MSIQRHSTRVGPYAKLRRAGRLSSIWRQVGWTAWSRRLRRPILLSDCGCFAVRPIDASPRESASDPTDRPIPSLRSAVRNEWLNALPAGWLTREGQRMDRSAPAGEVQLGNVDRFICLDRSPAVPRRRGSQVRGAR